MRILLKSQVAVIITIWVLLLFLVFLTFYIRDYRLKIIPVSALVGLATASLTFAKERREQGQLSKIYLEYRELFNESLMDAKGVEVATTATDVTSPSASTSTTTGDQISTGEVMTNGY